MSAIIKNARNAVLRLTNISESRSVSLASAALVIISAWRHYGTSTAPEPFQQEIWIEWMSWLFLFAGARVLRSDSTAFEPLASSFWSSMPALGLTSALAVSSEILSNFQIPAWTVPVVTVAILASEIFATEAGPTTFEIEPKNLELEELSTNKISSIAGIASSISKSSQFTLIMLSTFCAALFAFFFSYASADSWILMGALFVVARTGVLFCLSRISAHAESESPTSGTLRLIERLAIPSLAMLTLLLVVVRPDLEISSLEAFGHAIMQSIWWLALIVLINIGYTSTAANADTIGLAAQCALSTGSAFVLVAALLASYAASIQHIISGRSSVVARRIIHGIFILTALGAIATRDPRVSVEHVKATYFTKGHPIEKLVADARNRFEGMKARQSQTVQEAMYEYRRRYGREAPPGFDKWFFLAQMHDFVLIDEFDTFMNSIEPLYGLDNGVLHERLNMLINSTEIAYRTPPLMITNGVLSIPGDGYAEAISNPDFLRIIPSNITVLVNVWDEPMVASSFDTVGEAVKSAKATQRTQSSFPAEVDRMFISTGGQNGWHATSHACSAASPARQGTCPAPSNSTIPFIKNHTAALDICQNCHIRNEHGLLLNPGNMLLSHELLPLFSASKPSHFNDLLLPSPYYINNRGYNITADPEWSAKVNKFYWAGSSTGGENIASSWRKMQRSHLVLSTNDPNTPVNLLDRSGSRYIPRQSKMSEVADLFNTKISDVVQCKDDACNAMRAAFTLGRDPAEAAYQHKYVLDIDGNGFSGRYYRLLGSKAAVVKSTILQEWHDDRLLPWVHFIPLSTSYEELPEMARFLTGEGVQYGEVIARESAQWATKALRDVDLQLVWTRMLLEYARLMNP